jgi:hypothetical protein
VVLSAVGAVGLTLLPRVSAAVAVALAVIGVIWMSVAWCQPDEMPDRPAAGYRPTALLWGAIALCLCLWELVVFLRAEPPLHEYEYPTLSYLLQPVLDMPIYRAALLTLWLSLGFALLRWAQPGSAKRRGGAQFPA